MNPRSARQHKDPIIPLIKFLLIFSYCASVSSVSKFFYCFFSLSNRLRTWFSLKFPFRRGKKTNSASFAASQGVKRKKMSAKPSEATSHSISVRELRWNQYHYRCAAEDKYRSKASASGSASNPPPPTHHPALPNQDLLDRHYRGMKSRADHRMGDHRRILGKQVAAQNFHDRHQSGRTAAGQPGTNRRAGEF